MLVPLLTVFMCAQTLELPPALARLAPLVEQEQVFVDALRAADRECRARAGVLRARAGVCERAGNVESAATLRDEARQSLDTLRDAYEFALHRYGGNARLHAYYGELLYDHFGDAAGAQAEWNKAMSLDTGFAPAYNDFGTHLCQSGQVKIGLEYMDKALKLAPEDAGLHYNLAQTYLNASEAVAAAREWNQERVYREIMKLSERAARLGPSDFELLQDYAVNFFAAEQFGAATDWKRAAEAWRRARPYAKDKNAVFFTWLNEARAWIRAGDEARAERCLTESMRRHPGNDAARTLLEGLREGEPVL